MFDRADDLGTGDGTAVAVGRLDALGVRGWVGLLAGTDQDVSDAERIDQIRALEDLKAAACAAQARAAVDLDASQRRAQADAGVPVKRQGAGVASQVALPRRESPNRGIQHLGLAKILLTEMPFTLAAMTAGWLSEWRATLMARETACLELADRRHIDTVLAGNRAILEALGDGQLVGELRRLAYRLDPESVVRRNRKAESERRVSCRAAPDTMSYLTGLLPVAQGVSVFAALTREADSLKASGDARTRGQIMADTLVERVTGLTTATAVPVQVNLVMTDRSLLTGDNEPAELHGYGIIPAQTARDLVTHANAAGTSWVRRLYTTPDTGELIAMDSRSRLFPTGLEQLLKVRDAAICRTPWCDAPIRHSDHAVPYHAGGATSAANGQGLCEHCNHTKEALGWRARPRPGPRHTVAVTTPTRHTYTSTAPPLPGDTPRPNTRLEAYFAAIVLAA